MQAVCEVLSPLFMLLYQWAVTGVDTMPACFFARVYRPWKMIVVYSCLTMSCHRQAANEIAATLEEQTQPALTFAQLRRDIESNRIESTDQLLEFFGSSPLYRPLVDNPVLEHKSGAIHRDDVTAKMPRIVMAADNLVMHFTADVTKPSTELIELAEFIPAERRFAFRLINFKLSDPNLRFLEDARRSLSDSNIESAYNHSVGPFVFGCGSCHTPTQDGGLLPIWSPSTSLVRPFGGENDVIPSQSPQYLAYQQFQETLANPSLGQLYRRLTIKPCESNQGIVFSNRPNQRMTQLIFSHIIERAALAMQDNPLFKQMQLVTIGALLGCNDIAAFFPSEARQEHEKRLLSKIKDGELISLDRVIKDTDIKKEWRDTYRQHADFSNNIPNDLFPPGLYFEEATFLKMTSLGLEEAMTKVPLSANDFIETMLLRDDSKSDIPLADRNAQRERDKIYFDPEFIAILGRLRYLYRAFADEESLMPLPFFNELLPGGGGGEPMLSYRLEGGLQGLRRLASDFLGPRFLQDYPDLEAFAGRTVNPAHLVVPLTDYCRTLRTRSQSLFH